MNFPIFPLFSEKFFEFKAKRPFLELSMTGARYYDMETRDLFPYIQCEERPEMAVNHSSIILGHAEQTQNVYLQKKHFPL